jgi:hypothetical protein
MRVEHPEVRFGERDLAPSRRLIGGQHVGQRPVDVDADEVHRRADDSQVVIRELRRIGAGL